MEGTFYIAPQTQRDSGGNVLGYVMTPEKQNTTVVHDEHKPIPLDKDSVYEVVQQREHVPSKELYRYEPPKVERVRD